MSKTTGFRLPDWDALSDEQEAIINYPTDQDFLIQGCPGTGKTVMALYRAAIIARRLGTDVSILVYNRPLKQYLETVVSTDSRFNGVNVMTYFAWIPNFYKQCLRGKSVPKLDKYEFDWEQLLKDFRSARGAIPHIIIDEAQDFPIELIKGLKIVAESMTCFIDPNQAIESNKTDVIDTLNELCVESPYPLDTNYRNPKEVVELSRIYWNNEGDFAEPNFSGDGALKPVMQKCRDYDDQMNKMVRLIQNNRDKNIGILVNSKSLNVTYKGLTEQLDGSVNVQMYKASTSSNELNFNKNGVKVLSFGTMKGLEFDIVIITRFEKMKATGDEIADFNRAYVAVTRTRSQLYIMYFGTVCTPGWANVMPPLLKNLDLVKQI